MNNDAVLTVIQETEILGKKIVMYGNIENPYFVASDVAEWLGERDGYTVKQISTCYSDKHYPSKKEYFSCVHVFLLAEKP